MTFRHGLLSNLILLASLSTFTIAIQLRGDIRKGGVDLTAAYISMHTSIEVIRGGYTRRAYMLENENEKQKKLHF